MSVLTDIALKVEAFAEAALAEGRKELSEIIGSAADAVEAAEPKAETSLLALVDALGAKAAAIVVSVENEALSGFAKANLAATSLTDAAANAGIKIVDADASTLIKNAFTAAEAGLRALAKTVAGDPEPSAA